MISRVLRRQLADSVDAAILAATLRECVAASDAYDADVMTLGLVLDHGVPPFVGVATVEHETKCDRPRGGHCTCNPSVSVARLKD